MFESMLAGLQLILNWQTPLALAAGIVLGIVFGALPGLTTTMAMAIFVPVTFFMSPFVGIPFLLGLYKGGVFGGSVAAILIATPGTGAAAATVLDGYQLAKQGKAGKALKLALFASVLGETWGELILLFIVGLLASFALLFGPPEFFAVLLFSFTIISGLSGGSLRKGVISAAAGLFISTIGLDPVSATRRYTFGIMELDSGLSFVPLLIGLFAFSEVLSQIEQKVSGTSQINATLEKGEGSRLTWAEFKKCLPSIGLGSAIGTWIGLLPGIGQPVAAFLSYGFAKQRSKNPEEFGHGALEGVAAPEAGNNAVNGSAMVPMLALGIPGDTISAILLGALVAQGLSPGPLLFERQGPQIYAILLAMVLGNIIFLGIGYALIPAMAKVATVSKNLMIPGVVALSVVGAYAVNNSIFDVYVMIIFGIVGYLMIKGNYPISPLVIAFLLGNKTESSLSQSLLMSKGSLSIFFTSKISLFFIVVTTLVVIGIARKNFKNRNKPQEQEAIM